MIRKILLATLGVFVLWSILNFILHGVLLQSAYQDTMLLWRPMAEMKNGLMYLVSLISALVFVTIYARLISPRGMKQAISYGVLFGLGAGISMGYGTYAVQPIPYVMAFSWFLGTLVKASLAGMLAGFMIKDEPIEVVEEATA
jgi:hypothetical protein